MDSSMNETTRAKLAFRIYILLAMFLSTCGVAAADEPELQYYEIRIYKIYDFEKQQIADEYLRDALLPALNRQKIENIGVFHNLKDPNDHSIFVVIPFANLEAFGSYNQKLGTDTKYQEAGKKYLQRKKGDGIFDRIESRFLKAFTSIPKMELADFCKEKTSGRIFELRLYESHTEEHARRKVKMFDTGETQLMRDVEMGPVFFGETLSGPDLPNLVYMLSAKNLAEHEEHWKSFLKSDSWKKMKNLPEYKDTVSNIKNWFLSPTSYSQF